MFPLLRKDANRYFFLERGNREKLGTIDKLSILAFSHGFHVVACYRYSRFVRSYWIRGWLWKIPFSFFKLLDIFWSQTSQLLYGTIISSTASIAGGFYIGHVGGILIGPTQIGSNFTCTHNTTIGIGKTGEMRGIPTIGSNVWIGASSILYGKTTIGNEVTIAPGSVVSKCIPANSLVAGNPARVVQRDYDNAELIFGDGTVTSGAETMSHEKVD